MATDGRKLHPKVEAVIGLESLGVDLRSREGRRWRDHIRRLAAQLNNELTASQGLLVRRAASLAVFLEDAEATMLAGETIDQGRYVANTNALRGLLIQLGLASKSRDITKSSQQPADDHADAIWQE